MDRFPDADHQPEADAGWYEEDDFRIPDTDVYNSDGTDPDDEAMTVPEIYRSRIRDTIWIR